jgi:hypothetical protein
MRRLSPAAQEALRMRVMGAVLAGTDAAGRDQREPVGVNAMNAISREGRMYFTVFRQSFTTEVVIDFLERVIDTLEGKTHLVLDGHSATVSGSGSLPGPTGSSRTSCRPTPHTATPTSW